MSLSLSKLSDLKESLKGMKKYKLVWKGFLVNKGTQMTKVDLVTPNFLNQVQIKLSLLGLRINLQKKESTHQKLCINVLKRKGLQRKSLMFLDKKEILNQLVFIVVLLAIHLMLAMLETLV